LDEPILCIEGLCAQFDTAELDVTTRRQLERGQRITEILKQPQYEPMPLERQVMSLYAVVNGHLDDVAVEKARDFEKAFLDFMGSNHREIGRDIAEKQEIVPETEEALKAAIEEFKKNVPY